MTWKEAEPPDTDDPCFQMQQEGRGPVHAQCEKHLRDELLRFNEEYAEAWDLIDRMLPYVKDLELDAADGINDFSHDVLSALLAEIEEKRKPYG
jgi:hypothetical protein